MFAALDAIQGVTAKDQILAGIAASAFT